MESASRSRGLRVVVGALIVAVAGGLATRAAADAPAGRYVLKKIATVDATYDTKTKLTWQRTIDPPMSWANGAMYCATLAGGPWRMPTVKELLTIVDDSRYKPAIDTNAFPGGPPR